MFSILKKKKPFEQEAKKLYAQCLEIVRQPYFYTHYNIEDSMEARFDLLLVHIYIIIEHNLAYDPDIAGDLNQALFDALFADMDQTLREMGIGDMGLPKRIRKMMTGFNGRMHSYQQAFDAIDTDNASDALKQAIAKNIFLDTDISDNAKAVTDYIIGQRRYVKETHSGLLTHVESVFKMDNISSTNTES